MSMMSNIDIVIQDGMERIDHGESIQSIHTDIMEKYDLNANDPTHLKLIRMVCEELVLYKSQGA